jgi:hypothetical protein
MPHLVNWIIPGKVALIDYSGIVTTADAIASADELRELVGTGDKAHVIVDNSHVETIKVSMTDLPRLVVSNSHVTLWNVIINPEGQGKLSKMLSSIANHLMPSNYHYVTTMQEAIAFLRQEDPTIQI